MKKLLLILLCVPLIGLGQTKLFKIFYESGNIEQEIHYKECVGTLYGYRDCIKEGEFKRYYDNTIPTLLQKGKFKNDFKEGIWTSFYMNGNIKFKGEYINGHLSGIVKYYYESGKLEKEISYIWPESDKMGYYAHEELLGEWWLNGPCRYYYENGQLKYDGYIKYGKNDGFIREWYENGQLKKAMNYAEGLKDGLCKKWHLNGKLQEISTFKDGELISKKCYNEDGNEIECKE